MLIKLIDILNTLAHEYMVDAMGDREERLPIIFDTVLQHVQYNLQYGHAPEVDVGDNGEFDIIDNLVHAFNELYLQYAAQTAPWHDILGEVYQGLNLKLKLAEGDQALVQGPCQQGLLSITNLKGESNLAVLSVISIVSETDLSNLRIFTISNPLEARMLAVQILFNTKDLHRMPFGEVIINAIIPDGEMEEGVEEGSVATHMVLEMRSPSVIPLKPSNSITPDDMIVTGRQ